MRIFLTVLCLISYSFAAQAAGPWDKLVGCYKALSINGKRVPSARDIPSRITELNDPLFMNIDKTPIRSLFTSFMVDENGTNTDVVYPISFIDAPGVVVTASGPSVQFHFKGSVMLKRDEKVHSFETDTFFEAIGPDKVRFRTQDGRVFLMSSIQCP